MPNHHKPHCVTHECVLHDWRPSRQNNPSTTTKHQTSLKLPPQVTKSPVTANTHSSPNHHHQNTKLPTHPNHSKTSLHLQIQPWQHPNNHSCQHKIMARPSTPKTNQYKFKASPKAQDTTSSVVQIIVKLSHANTTNQTHNWPKRTTHKPKLPNQV